MWLVACGCFRICTSRFILKQNFFEFKLILNIIEILYSSHHTKILIFYIAERIKSHYTRPHSPEPERHSLVGRGFVPGLTIKKDAYRIIYWQLILIMGLALVLFLLRDIQSGLSALLGGLAYWLPTLLFVWRVFAKTTTQAAKRFLMMFTAGEIVKLLLSAILFVLVVKYLPVNVLSTLIGFAGAVVSFWIASMLLLTRHQGASQ